MQFRRFSFEKKLWLSYKIDKKKFERWKIIVVGLTVVATSLLLSTYLISGAMTRKKLSEDQNLTDKIEGIGSMFYQKSSSEEILLKLSQRILPMAEVYCSVKNCVVKCSLIPAASHPGIIAAVFLYSEYQNHCPDNLVIEELVFENCRFRNNALSSGWFPSGFQIKKLTLSHCALRDIGPDAFDSEQFAVLNSLTIVNNEITILRKSVFDYLRNLEELVIRNNAVKYAEADLLAGAANALQIVQIENAIFSEKVLINITGKSQLPKVLVLSLIGNYIRNIPSNVFQGIPKVESVYLTNSAILSIEPNAFDSFSGSVRQLFLSDNKITSLPRNVFRSILEVNPDFKLALANNDWNCNCELEWLKNLTSTYLQILIDEPRCSKPESNSLLKFSEAVFCDSDTSDDTVSKQSTDLSHPGYTTSPSDLENQITEDNEGLITLTCPMDDGMSRITSRKLLSVSEYRFQTRFPAFSVQEEEDGSVFVSLTSSSSPFTLIWFRDGSIDKAVFDSQDISCITNLRESLYLKNLRAGSLYTICLLNMSGDLTSPFNCLSLKMKDNYGNNLWLANEDKMKILGGLSAILIFVCLASVIGSYYVVRLNPRLLKGSKRIIIVRHRAADAIVLPEGLHLDSENRDFGTPPKTEHSISELPIQKEDYITPTSKRRLLTRKSSVISGTSSTRSSSATSYVSGIEPTRMQLMSWRIKQLRTNLSCQFGKGRDDDLPPPLPPPRNKSIPSLSLNVDERDTSNDRDLISIFTTADDRLKEVVREVEL